LIFTFTSSYLYISIIPAGFLFSLPSGTQVRLILFQSDCAQGGWKPGESGTRAEVEVNGLHWIAQILLAAVFLFAGFGEIFSYRSRAKVPPGRPSLGFPGLPYELAFAIGVVEIAGALALVVPIDLWPPDILPRLAAAGLGVLAIAGGIYHLRRRESAAPSVALFLLALFVIVARWPKQ